MKRACRTSTKRTSALPIVDFASILHPPPSQTRPNSPNVTHQKVRVVNAFRSINPKTPVRSGRAPLLCPAASIQREMLGGGPAHSLGDGRHINVPGISRYDVFLQRSGNILLSYMRNGTYDMRGTFPDISIPFNEDSAGTPGL